MEWFKEMVRQKVDYDHLAFDFVPSGEIADGLNRYIENSNIDLLAMLQRKDDTILEKYLRKIFYNKWSVK